MFDPSVDRYGGAYSSAEEGADPNVGHKTSDYVDYPRGKAYGFEYRKQEVVVQAIKSFGSVNEKEVVLFLFVKFVVKCVGEFYNIILPPAAPDKTFLSCFDDGVECWHDAVGHHTGDDAVGGVV